MNLPLSVSSVRRARIQATAEKASDIKEEFRELMKDGHKKLVVHFDSKDIEDAIDDIEKKDRLAVLVSSPQFGNGPPPLWPAPAARHTCCSKWYRCCNGQSSFAAFG